MLSSICCYMGCKSARLTEPRDRPRGVRVRRPHAVLPYRPHSTGVHRPCDSAHPKNIRERIRAAAHPHTSTGAAPAAAPAAGSRSITRTTWHSRARHSPTESTSSCVRALTFTRPSGTRSSLARLALIRALTCPPACSTLIRGFWQMTVTSTLPTRYPRPTMRSYASSMNTSESAPLSRGSLSGNSCPMSGIESAPRIASVTEWYTTSPSECATQPRLKSGASEPSNLTPPMMTG
mmetsp:Transcript_985/g.2927  ORF Transcript_985/g.2927 Transcript_985/m.2927 type:complete len:235 (+) Transcript_985:1172-1876(+)